MGLLQFAAVGNYRRFWDELKKLGSLIRRPALILLVDTALSTVLFGSGMQDYLNYHFYEKSFRERGEYITIGWAAKFYQTTAKLEYVPFFSVKPNFHKNFAKYTKRAFFDPETGVDSLREFLAAHPVFIYKPAVGLGGTDVQKLRAEDIGDPDAFLAKMRGEQAFAEELIVQDEAWARLCPKSCNTVRVYTTACRSESKVIYAAARIGNGSSVADNFHSGGMTVAVDMDRGLLTGTAFNAEREHFAAHPVTGVVFDGFAIPYWQEALAMCREAALVNDKVNVVGWDVAFTPSGPLLIEGNRGPGWDIVQILSGYGRKDLLRPLIAKLRESE
ncbi:MAG: hypothetical protein LBT21_02235 [Oscillospiraceae bacterium]|jgi:hypothetical protein|nr:hypothetical protein [Oscillospiraceae bacterium]